MNPVAAITHKDEDKETDGADVTSKILLAAATFLKDFPCAKIVRRSRGRRARARLAR